MSKKYVLEVNLLLSIPAPKVVGHFSVKRDFSHVFEFDKETDYRESSSLILDAIVTENLNYSFNREVKDELNKTVIDILGSANRTHEEVLASLSELLRKIAKNRILNLPINKTIVLLTVSPDEPKAFYDRMNHFFDLRKPYNYVIVSTKQDANNNELWASFDKPFKFDTATHGLVSTQVLYQNIREDDGTVYSITEITIDHSVFGLSDFERLLKNHEALLLNIFQPSSPTQGLDESDNPDLEGDLIMKKDIVYNFMNNEEHHLRVFEHSVVKHDTPFATVRIGNRIWTIISDSLFNIMDRHGQYITDNLGFAKETTFITDLEKRKYYGIAFWADDKETIDQDPKYNTLLHRLLFLLRTGTIER